MDHSALLLLPLPPTILCACVHSFYLTRLSKLPGLGGDKRPLSLENFLWDWQQQAEMGKGDLVWPQCCLLSVFFIGEQYSGHRKCAENDYFLLFL